MTLYRQEIIERYRFPRHRQAMDHPHTQGEVVNAFCGDELTLFLKFDSARERVEEVTFTGTGCALMTASADILCDHLAGKSRPEVTGFSSEQLLAFYAEPPTPSRLKCVLLPLEALRRALAAMW